MERELVELLRNRRLSVARRLFVLEEILAELPDDTGDALRMRIEELIERDRRNQQRQARTRRNHERGYPPRSDLPPAGADDSPRRTHLAFVELVELILTSTEPPVSRRLIAPVRRQLERLERFADRPDTSRDWTPSVCSGRPFDRPPT